MKLCGRPRLILGDHVEKYQLSSLVYFAFVHSYLVYGIEVYGNTY